MHVLDEEMDDHLVELLGGLKGRFVKVGKGVGRAGTTDENVVPLLHQLRSVTFFTHDKHYKQPQLCHSRYCLVYLDIRVEETIKYIRRVLRHPAFRTWAQRRGKLIWSRSLGCGYGR